MNFNLNSYIRNTRREFWSNSMSCGVNPERGLSKLETKALNSGANYIIASELYRHTSLVPSSIYREFREDFDRNLKTISNPKRVLSRIFLRSKKEKETEIRTTLEKTAKQAAQRMGLTMQTCKIENERLDMQSPNNFPSLNSIAESK